MTRLRRALGEGMARVGGLVHDRAWWVIGAGLGMTVVLGWLAATQLGVINNVNDLIRPDQPNHANYLGYKKEFGVREEIVVVVRSPDFERNKLVANDLGERFRQRTGDFERVYYRNDFSRLKNRMLHYAGEEELREIQQKLAGFRGLFDRPVAELNFNTLLREAVGKFDESYLRREQNWEEFIPFIDEFVGKLDRLVKLLEEREAGGGGVTASEITPEKLEGIALMERELERNEYVGIEDGKVLMLLLTPTEGREDSFSPYGEVIDRVRADVREARERYPGMEIGVTGEPVLMDDELKQSTKDSIVASLVTFVVIALLFILAYREVGRPLLAVLALVAAIAWAMGLAVPLVGHLNIISQACVIMLLGLGIDFGIQILGRYEEELGRHHTRRVAVSETLRHTGVAVLTGGGTTAAAFYTMCFNDFLGLAELGIIAGTGILTAMAASLLLLPALLVVWDRRRGEGTRGHPPHVAPAFRAELDRVLFSRPGWVLAAAAVLTLAALLSLPGVRFDYNLLNLQNPDLESVKFEKDLVTDSASGTIFGVLVARNIEEARAKAALLKQKETVAGVRTVDMLLPEHFEEKRPLLEAIREELDRLKLAPPKSNVVDVKAAVRDLRGLLEASQEGLVEARKYQKGVGGALAKIGGKKELVQSAIAVFEKLLPPLERAVKALKGLSDGEAQARLNRYESEVIGGMQKEFDWLRTQDFGTPITLEDLPEELRTRYVSPQGRILIEVDPKENVWEQEPNRRFVEDLWEVDQKATGTPVQNYVYINLLRESYVQAAWMAFVAIVLLIGLHFRSVSKLLLTLLPLGLGVAWTGGVMVWLDLPFNPANIITLPLVIGIGVAFGVYVVDRHGEDGEVRLCGTSTGKAVLLSALTTLTGFASMMLGKYVGLKSLGLVMALGVLMCFLTAFLVLPQILVWMDRVAARRGGHARGEHGA